jgi:hypothetical protein
MWTGPPVASCIAFLLALASLQPTNEHAARCGLSAVRLCGALTLAGKRSICLPCGCQHHPRFLSAARCRSSGATFSDRHTGVNDEQSQLRGLTRVRSLFVCSWRARSAHLHPASTARSLCPRVPIDLAALAHPAGPFFQNSANSVLFLLPAWIEQQFRLRRAGDRRNRLIPA